MEDWTQFDNMLDAETMNKVNELDAGRREIPPGKYEVVPEQIELSKSKKGNPMLVARLRIVHGEFNKSIIFVNQVMTTSFQIHKAKELIKGLNPSSPVKFESYTQWAIYLMGVAEEVCCKGSYVLEYGEEPNKNDPENPYKTYKFESGPYQLPDTYEPPKAKSDNWKEQ